MATKTVPFTQAGIATLPDDKPVVYKILTSGGTVNYIGKAMRGRVRARITEHLSGGPDPVPGATVHIEQQSSIGDAGEKEMRSINRTQPKYNELGK